MQIPFQLGTGVGSVMSSSEGRSEETCHLWALQRMLMQQITLRCLSLEDLDNGDRPLPNNDKELQEVLSVLRIVFYASILASDRLDSPQQIQSERKLNAEFEQLVARRLEENGTLHLSLQVKNRIPSCDPLGKFLGVSLIDCRNPVIPFSEFVNEILNTIIRPHEDIIKFIARLQTGVIAGEEHNAWDGKFPEWIKVGKFESISFMEYAFTLQTSTKTMHLYYDNRYRMFEARRHALARSIFNEISESMYLKIFVKRETIVEDALTHLDLVYLQNPADLRKQLFVEFEGEQGIDEGGLTKEFFQLIIAKLFNADYAMFILNQETQNYWFNISPLDDMDREYCLIGTILGLAIYNHVILDVRFPAVLYRKLLGKLGNFHDLEADLPSLHRGLKAMLEFEGSETQFDECFCVNFEISYQDVFGAMQTQELKPGGHLIPVTLETRDEYVHLYADFLLNKSVEKQFNAFRRGFHMVVAHSPLPYLFRPDELETLIRGSDNYDFAELQRVTTYGPGYSTDHHTIQNFWSIVHDMSHEEKRNLLKFTTGTDGIPVGGMAKMKFSEASRKEVKMQLLAFNKCDLDIQRLTAARIGELTSFEEVVGPAICTSQAVTPMQRLPVRLRRRAASQYPNRLPRRFHEGHPEKKSGEDCRKKQRKLAKEKLCRRKRRRQSRLQSIRSRSAATNDWLPTHLWHAKRFKIISKWGFRLPLHSNEKLFKATQSATLRNCSLMDMSYLRCWQISGAVQAFFHKHTNLEFAHVRPNKELSCLLYDQPAAHMDDNKGNISRRVLCPLTVTIHSTQVSRLWAPPLSPIHV
ncbi:Ubiquitin-protein ligase E3A [Cichlidogyrus casuarinus]|uniref:HECT-type E3 ubiquitin transferase n=1 Tax=Cichlidogyrus casuarinus TaxID=1844966 RepID=A0ABD2PZQ1_9PLAT